MEENRISERLDEQGKKLDAIYKSVEQTRKLFLATVIISVVMFVLPLLGLFFVIPWAIGAISSAYSGLL